MTARKLREQCVAVPESTVLVGCFERDIHQDASQPNLVGHAFATVWDFSGGRVGWVTQLVVNLQARRRYIATFHGITAIGLVSSHPSACHVITKYARINIQSVDLQFCQQNAQLILDRSPVKYIKDMVVHGSLFDEECTTGAISSVYTKFFIDHKEPLRALDAYKARGKWVLGELLDGHEFLIILPVNQPDTPELLCCCHYVVSIGVTISHC